MKFCLEFTVGEYCIETKPLWIKKFNHHTLALHYSQNKTTIFEFDLEYFGRNKPHPGLILNVKLLGYGLELEFISNNHT